MTTTTTPTTVYPTHEVFGIFNDGRNRVRTEKIKFHPGEQPLEEAGRKVVENYLGQHKRKQPPVIESVTVTVLKAPKLGAKLNNQHDYVSLRAVFLDGKLNLTTSWGGMKMSGDFLRRPESNILFDAAGAYEKRTKRNLVGVMDELCNLAIANKDFASFCTKAIETLKTFEPPVKAETHSA